MAEDLQRLLEKIQKDGVDKANAEAARIVEEAKAKAATIIADAKAGAEDARAKAQADAEAFSARAEESIRQAARDTVLGVESAVRALLEKALAKNVDAALADPARAAEIAAVAIREAASGEAEIAAAPKLVEALRAQTAGTGDLRITLDESTGSGFRVKLDGGRIEHDFTGPAVADALARRLRPRLAALVKQTV